jgi:hypothetical protein
MTYSTFTLTGKHTTPAGTAHQGRVKVIPNAEIRESGKLIMSGPMTAELDPMGGWSLVLPCDSPGLNPSSGIGYTVVYQFNAASVNPQAFAALPELAGTVLDASEIVAGSTPTAPTTIPVAGPVGPPGPPGIALDTDGVPYLTI